jgi:hypothetical protein
MIGIITTALLLALLRASYEEREWRAVGISFLTLGGNLTIWWGFNNFHEVTLVSQINFAFITSILVFTLFSFIKWFPEKKEFTLESMRQFDERNHMFARNNLQYHPPGAKQMKQSIIFLNCYQRVEDFMMN